MKVVLSLFLAGLSTPGQSLGLVWKGPQPCPELPSSFQTTQALGRHAQESHWREAGRWHLVASPDNSTGRKMAA